MAGAGGGDGVVRAVSKEEFLDWLCREDKMLGEKENFFGIRILTMVIRDGGFDRFLQSIVSEIDRDSDLVARASEFVHGFRGRDGYKEIIKFLFQQSQSREGQQAIRSKIQDELNKDTHIELKEYILQNIRKLWNVVDRVDFVRPKVAVRRKRTTLGDGLVARPPLLKTKGRGRYVPLAAAWESRKSTKDDGDSSEGSGYDASGSDCGKDSYGSDRSMSPPV